MAFGFFFSEELTTAASVSDEEFINRLYLTMMDREGDAAGIEYWNSQINIFGREGVFLGFINSVEWSELCSDYGILK